MDEVGISNEKDIRYEYMLVQFYNRIGCIPVDTIDEIPADALGTLAYLDYRHIVEPMIANDLRRGLSQRFCARRYGVGHRVIRTISEKYFLN